MNCPACGTSNAAESKFCMSCGQPLNAAASPEPESPAAELQSPPAVAAELQPPPAVAESEPDEVMASGPADASLPDIPPPMSDIPPMSNIPPMTDAPPPPPAPPTPEPSSSSTAASPPPMIDPSPSPASGPSSSSTAEPSPPLADAPAPPVPGPSYAPPSGPPFSAPQAPAWSPPPPPPPGWGAPPPPAPSGWPAPNPGGPGQSPNAPPQSAGPPASPFVPAAPVDPNRLGAAVARLSSGARKVAKAPLLVAAVLLEDGELVECAAAGRIEGIGAVAVLTDRRILLVNERAWSPMVASMAVDPGLAVQGWQDSRTASLTFVAAGRQLVLEQITDKQLAVEVAGRIRARNGIG